MPVYSYTRGFSVSNAYGTAAHKPRFTCGCKSWEEHWRRGTGSRRETCTRIGCQNPVQVGAHVDVVFMQGGRVRRHTDIVGLCRSCNALSPEVEFRLDSRTWTVSASPLDTCPGPGW